MLQKHSAVTCILHVCGIQHGDFTPLSNVKGSATDKLVQLHRIRNRRLSKPLNSPNRMKEFCRLIPDNLAGADLKVIGCHRGCYQYFTKNQDRLMHNVQETPTVRASSSPRK